MVLKNHTRIKEDIQAHKCKFKARTMYGWHKDKEGFPACFAQKYARVMQGVHGSRKEFARFEILKKKTSGIMEVLCKVCKKSFLCHAFFANLHFLVLDVFTWSKQNPFFFSGFVLFVGTWCLSFLWVYLPIHHTEGHQHHRHGGIANKIAYGKPWHWEVWKSIDKARIKKHGWTWLKMVQ